MTMPRDPDQLIAAWLDEHAVPLPTSTQRAIEVAIRTIPRHRRLTWLPRRPHTMNLFLRAALAVAVLAVGIGTIAFLQRTPGTGAPPSAPPSDGPGASSSALPDPSTWEAFTSERFGFEVRYPAGWDVYPATVDAPFYDEDNESQEVMDRITVGAGFSGLYVASAPLQDGLTQDAWLERYVCPCEPGFAEFQRMTVDGQPALARLETSNEPFLSIYAFVDGRVYNILGVNVLVRDRPLLDAFLSTFRFHPEDAVDTR